MSVNVETNVMRPDPPKGHLVNGKNGASVVEEMDETFTSNKTLQSEFCRLNDSQIKERLNKMFKAWLDTMGNEHCDIVMDLQVAALNNIAPTDVLEVLSLLLVLGG